MESEQRESFKIYTIISMAITASIIVCIFVLGVRKVSISQIYPEAIPEISSANKTTLDINNLVINVSPDVNLYHINNSEVYRNTALGFQITLPGMQWAVPSESDTNPHVYNDFSCANNFKVDTCVGAEIQEGDERFSSRAEALVSLTVQQLNPVDLSNSVTGMYIIKSKVPPPVEEWVYAYHIFYPGTDRRFVILTNSESVEESVIKKFKQISDPKKLTDVFYKTAVGNSATRVLAKGDINSDGYNDAVVEEMHCGASCSTSLQLVLNIKGEKAFLFKDKNYPDTFAPAFKASSVIKSEVNSVEIKNGRILLTGKGLACTSKPEDVCTDVKWNLVKTATYVFDGTNIVQYSIK